MTQDTASALRIHPADNAIVALQDLRAGQQVTAQDGGCFTLTDDIPAKHKFAACDLNEGDVVKMYGVMVGRASAHISAGGRISRANLDNAVTETQLHAQSAPTWDPPDIEQWRDATFDGYHRANGTVGTANVWIVVPLVFCENRNLMLMKNALLRPLGLDHGTPYERFVRRMVQARASGTDISEVEPFETARSEENTDRVFPNLDGVRFLTHALGCGGTDDDTRTLVGLLAGYITHPNVAGTTVLSLGCQKAQIEMLQSEIEKRDPKFSRPLLFFEQQKSKSEKQMMSDAIRETFVGMSAANEIERQPAPLSGLNVGMECGGSDGFSGISANPVMGGVSDRLAALGASVILGEFPELSGVEQLLMDRCTSADLATRFRNLMDDYQRAAERAGSTFAQNPSHGNVADGLITGAMKSAGAALKGGSSPVCDVLDYPEVVTRKGLNLLCTPGSDVESTTAMGGAHANLIMFSTGLGTPTGNAVSPTIKISTNSSLAQRLPDMIDFDAGSIISGERTPDQLADQLLDLAIEAASGRYQTRATLLGQEDFIPWKRGVSL